MSEVNSRYYPPPEAPVQAEPEVDLNKLTTKELGALAKEKGIDIGGLKKAEMIEAIEGEEEEDE